MENFYDTISMKIEQIISPDGYISDITRQRSTARKFCRRDSPFPMSQIISGGPSKRRKPFIFSGRSGNAQIGIKTDLLSPETVPEIEG